MKIRFSEYFRTIPKKEKREISHGRIRIYSVLLHAGLWQIKNEIK
jgi:hypothetical protein